jgi:hypothetical protein
MSDNTCVINSNQEEETRKITYLVSVGDCLADYARSLAESAMRGEPELNKTEGKSPKNVNK